MRLFPLAGRPPPARPYPAPRHVVQRGAMADYESYGTSERRHHGRGSRRPFLIILFAAAANAAEQDTALDLYGVRGNTDLGEPYPLSCRWMPGTTEPAGCDSGFAFPAQLDDQCGARMFSRAC